MHPLQHITESQQVLTTTGVCIVSLQIMHSRQSKISLTMAFCTARTMENWHLVYLQHILAILDG